MFGKFALNFMLNTKSYARLLSPHGSSTKKTFYSRARYCRAGTFICLPQVVSLLMQHADQLTKNFPQSYRHRHNQTPFLCFHLVNSPRGLTLLLEDQALFCYECALYLPPKILYSQSPCSENKPSS